MVSLLTSLLAAAFGWAALAKLLRAPAWRRALEGYGLSSGITAIATWAVPSVELAVAGLLLFGPPRAGAAATVALLGAFSAAIVRASALQGSRLPCGCFGGDGRRDFRVMLLRNALLGIPAVVILLFSNAAVLRAHLGAGDVVPLLLTALTLGLVGWVLLQVFPERRRR